MSTTAGVVVRRVRPDEWQHVRELRLEALRDPDARMAFLDTFASSRAQPDEFWRQRALAGAESEAAAQFVGIDGAAWVASATGLVREAGSLDHLARTVHTRRVDVVGVYVGPGHRGSGLLDALFHAVAGWAAELGIDRLTLDVHADNARAQRAYRRVGFVETGTTFTGPIGPELEMRWIPPITRDDRGAAGIVPA